MVLLRSVLGIMTSKRRRIFFINTFQYRLLLFKTNSLRLSYKFILSLIDTSQSILKVSNDAIWYTLKLCKLKVSILILSKYNKFFSEVIQRHYLFSLKLWYIVEHLEFFYLEIILLERFHNVRIREIDWRFAVYIV